MFLQTQQLQVTRAFLALLLPGLVDATPAPSLNITAKVMLYQAGPPPSFDADVTTYTESTFHGYTAVTLASVMGPINLSSAQTGMHQQVDYVLTTPAGTPESALGMLLVDTTKAIVYAGEAFARPVPFAAVGDALSYDLVLAIAAIWPGVNG